MQFPPNTPPPEYDYSTFLNASSMSNANKGLRTAKKTRDEEMTPNAANVTESVLESMILLQQRQTNIDISSSTTYLINDFTTTIHKQIQRRSSRIQNLHHVVDTRVQHRVSNDADLLYYLNQHLSREPKDLIKSCLHMDPDEGYSEASRLLKKEYGDPYKISMAYTQKILNWSPIKSDEGKALKTFSLLLIKCKTAVKSIDYLCVLDHVPNMQAVVSKLPFHLQAKGRDQDQKRQRKDSRPLRIWPILLNQLLMLRMILYLGKKPCTRAKKVTRNMRKETVFSQRAGTLALQRTLF